METEGQAYLLFDRVNPLLRSIVSAALIMIAFVFQLTSKNFFVGLPFLIGCLLINLIRGVSIKTLKAREKKWEEVTPDRIQTVYDQALRVKKFRSSDVGVGCLIAIGFLSIFVLPTRIIPFTAMIIILDTIVLFAGLMLSGRKSAWMVRGLDLKSEIILRLLNSEVIKGDAEIKAIPLLEIGQDPKGAFPLDARLKLKFVNAPEDFLGLQGQISLNSVKAKDYPYFYCVLVGKKSFGLLDKIGAPTLEKLVIEEEREADVDVVVIRQKTTKTSGYYTDKNSQDYILFNSIKLAKQLLEK